MSRSRARLPLLGIAVVLISGCRACSHRTIEVEVGPFPLDQIPRDASDEIGRDMSREDVPTPPWADGTYRLLNRPAVQTLPPPAQCGTATLVAGLHYSPNATNLCLREGVLYGDVTTSWAYQLGVAPTDFLVLADLPLRTHARCQRDALVMSLSSSETRAAAIVSFSDTTMPGRVLWQTQWGPAPGPQSGALLEFVASEQLFAWAMVSPEHGAQLFVSGPHGESPRAIMILDRAHMLQASGGLLVYADASDIWMYDVRRGSTENLTHDDAEQWSPWTDGAHVVWMDQHDTPSGGLFNPDNPEVYSLDLATRETVRITNDPPTLPVGQSTPVVAGNWIVWTDFRNAARPNPGELVSDRMELYGFNYATRREYPIVTGPIVAAVPAILGGRVYFPCQPPPPDTHFGLFVANLPTP